MSDADFFHQPYISAVTSALAEAGITISALSIDESLCGAQALLELDLGITFDAYGADDVALRWDEESGWMLLWESRRKSWESLASLCDALIPAPHTVARAVRAALISRPAPDTERARYRRVGEGHREFNALLAAYA